MAAAMQLSTVRTAADLKFKTKLRCYNARFFKHGLKHTGIFACTTVTLESDLE